MNIGEIAEKTGLAASKIRFYERIGLLKAVKRKANGYRHYSDEAIAQLKLIVIAQQAGFSLEELQTLVPADLSVWNHAELVTALQQKIQGIEAMQQQLASSKAQLQDLLFEIKAKPEDMDCASNAKRVLAQFGLEANAATSNLPKA